jgi:hypothetical protein
MLRLAFLFASEVFGYSNWLTEDGPFNIKSDSNVLQAGASDTDVLFKELYWSRFCSAPIAQSLGHSHYLVYEPSDSYVWTIETGQDEKSFQSVYIHVPQHIA